jgi:Winged helix DNA-binding domain
MSEQRLGWWSYRRQLLGQSGGDPEAALRDVIGVYSSHPSAPLSLHARCRSLDAVAFRALDVLRLPAMRGSIHLLPRETAHLAFRALPEPPARSARRLQGFGLSAGRYAELRARVLELARSPRTARELRSELGVDRELTGVVGQMTRDGELIRIGAAGLRSNELRYQVWEPPAADRDQALAWLAGEYLRAFGPARRQDFEWWAGVSASRARRALAEHEVEDIDDGLLLPIGMRDGFEAVKKPPKRSVDLLPKWDCYTMGYPIAGRGRFAHADIVASLYDHRGDGLPVVLAEGMAVGTWSFRPGTKVAVDLNLFEPPTPALSAALDNAMDRVRALLA